MRDGLPWIHLKPKLSTPYKFKIKDHPLQKKHPKEKAIKKLMKKKK
jgi:hypothetical protein